MWNKIEKIGNRTDSIDQRTKTNSTKITIDENENEIINLIQKKNHMVYMRQIDRMRDNRFAPIGTSKINGYRKRKVDVRLK